MYSRVAFRAENSSTAKWRTKMRSSSAGNIIFIVILDLFKIFIQVIFFEIFCFLLSLEHTVASWSFLLRLRSTVLCWGLFCISSVYGRNRNLLGCSTLCLLSRSMITMVLLSSVWLQKFLLHFPLIC